MSRTLLLAAAALAACAPFAAHAAPTVHFSPLSFLAAATGAVTDTFDDLAPGALDTGPLLRTLGGYGYAASAESGLWGLSNPADPADRWLSTAEATDWLQIGDFSLNVYAVGASFFNTGFYGDKVAITFSVVDTDGSEASYEHVFEDEGGFFGIVSSTGIASLRIGGGYSDFDGWTFPTIDDLILGGIASPAPVPEPGGLALALAGLALLAPARVLAKR